MNARDLDPDQLYWGSNGMVNCGDHAPLRGSDTWVWGAWEALPADIEGFDCEVCHKS